MSVQVATRLRFGLQAGSLPLVVVGWIGSGRALWQQLSHRVGVLRMARIVWSTTISVPVLLVAVAVLLLAASFPFKSTTYIRLIPWAHPLALLVLLLRMIWQNETKLNTLLKSPREQDGR